MYENYKDKDLEKEFNSEVDRLYFYYKDEFTYLDREQKENFLTLVTSLVKTLENSVDQKRKPL